jgi:hypothetical protein
MAKKKAVKKSDTQSDQYVREDGRAKHYFLGEDLLTPNVNKCDGGRLNMFISHLAQFLTLDCGEVPRVFTRFENQIGKYSQGMGYVSLKEKATFIAEIALGENERYLFFAYDDQTVDVVCHMSSTRLTESYGYANNFVMPETEPGDEVEAGTLISHNNMYDEHLNLKYGVNLKTIFLAKDGLTFEDGIIISETGSKKLGHTAVHEAIVSLNNNDVLVNLYGDKTNYKPFPNVGEEIENGVLCSRRRINYSTVLTDFKENDRQMDVNNDTLFYFDGAVESIEIFSNLSEDELKQEYNAPIKTLLDSRRDLYKDIKETIESFKAEGYALRDDCGFLYQKATDYLSGKKFSYDKSEFEGTIIRFKIRETVPLKVGSKITGRVGNKGVISKILPDEEMPRVSDTGEIPDVVLNSLGVVGRCNISQLYEHELNFIADEIVKKYPDDKKGVASLWSDILEFYQIIGTGQGEFLKEKLGTDAKAIAAYVADVRENGLLIHQPPFFENANPEKMIELYNHFGVEKLKFEGIEQPLVFGSLYFIKLRHEAIGKFSARSAGQVSLLNVPFKSNEMYKKGTAPHNNSPIRFGEQELFNMLLLANQEGGASGVINFLRHYSSHNIERRNLLQKLLRVDPDRIDSVAGDGKSEKMITNAAQVIRSFFAGMGITLESDQLDQIEDIIV